MGSCCKNKKVGTEEKLNPEIYSSSPKQNRGGQKDQDPTESPGLSPVTSQEYLKEATTPSCCKTKTQEKPKINDPTITSYIPESLPANNEQEKFLQTTYGQDFSARAQQRIKVPVSLPPMGTDAIYDPLPPAGGTIGKSASLQKYNIPEKVPEIHVIKPPDSTLTPADVLNTTFTINDPNETYQPKSQYSTHSKSPVPKATRNYATYVQDAVPVSSEKKVRRRWGAPEYPVFAPKTAAGIPVANYNVGQSVDPNIRYTPLRPPQNVQPPQLPKTAGSIPAANYNLSQSVDPNTKYTPLGPPQNIQPSQRSYQQSYVPPAWYYQQIANIESQLRRANDPQTTRTVPKSPRTFYTGPVIPETGTLPTNASITGTRPKTVNTDQPVACTPQRPKTATTVATPTVPETTKNIETKAQTSSTKNDCCMEKEPVVDEDEESEEDSEQPFDTVLEIRTPHRPNAQLKGSPLQLLINVSCGEKTFSIGPDGSPIPAQTLPVCPGSIKKNGKAGKCCYCQK